MRSPSTGRRRSGHIPANRRPGPAGRGQGSSLGSLGVDSWARLGRERAGKVGAPVASDGGHRDRCAGEVAALWGRRARRRARVGAREGGGGFVWTCGQPEPELAATASIGAGGGSGRGRQAREECTLWRLLYSGLVPLCCAECRTEGRPRAKLRGGGAGSTDGQTDMKGPAVRQVLVRPRDMRRGKTSRRPRDGAWLRGMSLGQCSQPRSAGRRPGHQGGMRALGRGATSRSSATRCGAGWFD
jgi:hypothetical protein